MINIISIIQSWMHLGVISDVHANLPALESVLTELERIGVDDIIHCGDIVGYNSFPNEVINCFRDYKIKTILGNHDEAVINGTVDGFNEHAAIAVTWTKKILTLKNLNYLKKLKFQMNLRYGKNTIKLFHGSPWNLNDYILEKDVDSNLLEITNADILIFGHTHQPYIKKFHNKYVFNPGSVGQPRDNNWRTGYSIINMNPDYLEIKHYRVEYNIEQTINSIKAVGLPQKMCEILQKAC